MTPKASLQTGKGEPVSTRRIDRQIPEPVAARKERIRAEAEEIVAEALAEAERLKAQGWTQQDFARAAYDLFDEPYE